jgi:hypothetical protein
MIKPLRSLTVNPLTNITLNPYCSTNVLRNREAYTHEYGHPGLTARLGGHVAHHVPLYPKRNVFLEQPQLHSEYETEGRERIEPRDGFKA